VRRSGGLEANFTWVFMVCSLWLAGTALAEPPQPESTARQAVSPADPRDLRSLLQLQGDREKGELIIESSTLELETGPDEGRLLTFIGNVHVRQGDLELRAEWLEADYPPQDSEPSRLLARGAVQVDQPGQRAHCAEAEYVRAQDRLTCRGEARLVQGCDVVAGESIEFDLASNRVRVIGAARVVIAPRRQEGGCASEQVPTDEAP
jgi:lipopolysaccharide transport protein LptA